MKLRFSSRAKDSKVSTHRKRPVRLTTKMTPIIGTCKPMTEGLKTDWSHAWGLRHPASRSKEGAALAAFL